jgi:hypothetical protein
VVGGGEGRLHTTWGREAPWAWDERVQASNFPNRQERLIVYPIFLFLLYLHIIHLIYILCSANCYTSLKKTFGGRDSRTFLPSHG